MITLHKAFRDSYWWKSGSEIDIDPDRVESVEQVTEQGSNAYVLVTMKSGAAHKIYGDIHDVRKKLFG